MGLFVHHRIVTAVTRLEFVSDGVSHTVLRSRWCNFTVLNVQAPSEKKNDDSKDSFFEELEQGFLSTSQVPFEYSIRTFYCKSGEREYFQTDSWE